MKQVMKQIMKQVFSSPSLKSAILGAVAAITLPAETAAYKNIPGVDLANGYCLTCHSADYVLTQPPAMPRKFWEAEVTKMQKVFGAPIPDDQLPALIDYLTKANAEAR